MFEPDIVDLQSWLSQSTDKAISHVWEATQYLSSPYATWLAFWKSQGCPDISS